MFSPPQTKTQPQTQKKPLSPVAAVSFILSLVGTVFFIIVIAVIIARTQGKNLFASIDTFEQYIALMLSLFLVSFFCFLAALITGAVSLKKESKLGFAGLIISAIEVIPSIIFSMACGLTQSITSLGTVML